MKLSELSEGRLRNMDSSYQIVVSGTELGWLRCQHFCMLQRRQPISLARHFVKLSGV